MEPNTYQPMGEQTGFPEAKFKFALFVAYVIVIAFAIWQIVPAVITAGRTGTLNVTSSASNTQISLSEENHQATSVGTGSARVRLQPGTYQVAGFADGHYATQIVTVSVGQTTNMTLNLNQSQQSQSNNQQARTVVDVNFEGISQLLSYGISSQQTAEMQQYFFQFKPTENTVSIDTSSISSAPRDPNVISPQTLDFTVTIDNTTYNAAVSYYDTNNITLTLSNPQTGAQVFTAGSISPPSS